jgi:hypothetical protein
LLLLLGKTELVCLCKQSSSSSSSGSKMAAAQIYPLPLDRANLLTMCAASAP